MYRMKHKPSGMYFCPSRELKVRDGENWGYVKSNLSKDGKIYPRNPSFGYIGKTFYDHSQITWSNTGWKILSPRNLLMPFRSQEWEIEEIG